MNLEPPDTSADTKIEEKETKHYGKPSSPFKVPKPAPSPRLPLPPFSGGRDRSQGGGESFPTPSTCTPSLGQPQVLQEPEEQQWRKGESFLMSCLALWHFCFPQVLPAPSLPTLVNCLGSQMHQRQSASSGPSASSQSQKAGDLPVARPWQVASATIPLRSFLPGPCRSAHLTALLAPWLLVLRRDLGQQGATCRKRAPPVHARLTPKTFLVAALTSRNLWRRPITSSCVRKLDHWEKTALAFNTQGGKALPRPPGPHRN